MAMLRYCILARCARSQCENISVTGVSGLRIQEPTVASDGRGRNLRGGRDRRASGVGEGQILEEQIEEGIVEDIARYYIAAGSARNSSDRSCQQDVLTRGLHERSVSGHEAHGCGRSAARN